MFDFISLVIDDQGMCLFRHLSPRMISSDQVAVVALHLGRFVARHIDVTTLNSLLITYWYIHSLNKGRHDGAQ